jgi:hypothetical protein
MRCVDSPADHVSGRLTQLAAFDRGCAKQRGHFRVVSSSISLTVNFNGRPNPKTFQNAPYIGCDDIKRSLLVIATATLQAILIGETFASHLGFVSAKP